MADYGVEDYANSRKFCPWEARSGWQLSMKFSTPSKVNEITSEISTSPQVSSIPFCAVFPVPRKLRNKWVQIKTKGPSQGKLSDTLGGAADISIPRQLALLD